MQKRVGMSPSPSPAERRLLRVGVIHGGRIVEERVLSYLGDITIGTSPRNTLIIPWDEAPNRWRLFEARGGRRFLHLGVTMNARIADGAAVTNIDARGGETPPPIPLAHRARGKVSFGDTTVLFQLLRPPPPQPRPQLPHSLHRRVMSEVDRVFAVVVALTALLHVAVVAYLRQVDWPRRPPIEAIPDRFIHQMARAPRPTPPPVAPPVVADKGQTAPRRPHALDSAAQRPAHAPAKTHADLENEVRRMGLIPLLTAKAADGRAALPDLLANGAVDRSLDEALRGVGGVKIAGNGELRGLPRPGSGTGKVGIPADLPGGSRIVDARPSGPVVERDISSRLKLVPPVVEGGHADLASITQEIRSRRKAIAACYERALKQTPTLTGKLVIRFSIAAAGTVSAVDIDDDTLGAPEVGACVRALVLRWRFAPPADAPVELSFPFIFQAAG
jgi:hypothetical protein